MVPFLLQCPKCGQKMKYQPVDAYFSDRSKKCVYCGKSFGIGGRVVGKVL